jgi:hypothetical protein
MTGTKDRLRTAVASWIKRLPSWYGAMALTLCILGFGVLAVLLVQPSPLTFTEGWSAPQGIDDVRAGYPHRAVIDHEGYIHLIWEKRENRRDAAFYARLDRHGQLLDRPSRLSDPNVNAEDVAVALTGDGVPLCFWIEKGHEDGTQRLMMARPGTGQSPLLLSTSPKIMRDLAVTGDEEGRVFLAWSDNRQGLYDIYLTVFDPQGNVAVAERRITDTGSDFVFEPALAVGGGVVHLVYFADKVTDQELVHRAYDVAGKPLTEPQVLERVSQAATTLGGSTPTSYPVLAVAEADGQMRLYESLGSMVRQRKIDRNGTIILPPEPFLRGSRYYSQVNLARAKGQQWIVWADLRWDSGDRFQVYTASLDQEGHVGEETRLTFATTSALWPVMVLDDQGGQHVIWQQNAGPYAYQMLYINNLDPASVSAWQRLGFSGVGGAWSFLLALAQGAILAVITTFVRIWRPAIAWAVTALALQIVRRVEAVRPYAHVVAWLVLLMTLFVVVRPEAQTLGQMPIDVADTSHWVMGVFASATVLYLGRVWRRAFRGVLIWAGMAGLWTWVYYWLNLILILREGFAV